MFAKFFSSRRTTMAIEWNSSWVKVDIEQSWKRVPIVATVSFFLNRTYFNFSAMDEEKLCICAKTPITVFTSHFIISTSLLVWISVALDKTNKNVFHKLSMQTPPCVSFIIFIWGPFTHFVAKFEILQIKCVFWGKILLILCFLQLCPRDLDVSPVTAPVAWLNNPMESSISTISLSHLASYHNSVFHTIYILHRITHIYITHDVYKKHLVSWCKTKKCDTPGGTEGYFTK